MKKPPGPPAPSKEDLQIIAKIGMWNDVMNIIHHRGDWELLESFKVFAASDDEVRKYFIHFMEQVIKNSGITFTNKQLAWAEVVLEELRK